MPREAVLLLGSPNNRTSIAGEHVCNSLQVKNADLHDRIQSPFESTSVWKTFVRGDQKFSNQASLPRCREKPTRSESSFRGQIVQDTFAFGFLVLCPSEELGLACSGIRQNPLSKWEFRRIPLPENRALTGHSVPLNTGRAATSTDSRVSD